MLTFLRFALAFFLAFLHQEAQLVLKPFSFGIAHCVRVLME
jgi:hypothetical protein